MNLNELKNKKETHNNLVAALEQSLAIQKLWPEAFDCGTVSSFWKGNLYEKMIYTIKRSDGEYRIFMENELPDSLIQTLPKERLTIINQQKMTHDSWKRINIPKEYLNE